MDINQPAFTTNLPGADDLPVAIPLSPSAPAVGDVAVVLNGKVFPVYPAQAGDVPCMVVDVPTAPTKQYCIALETPQILPLMKSGSTYLTLLDSPQETDSGFNNDWKDEPGYVKNVTGLTFGCVSADEYDDPETIQYVYSTTSQYPYPAMRTLNASGYSGATSPYMMEQSAGYPAPNPIATASPVAANGTEWDFKPFVPSGTSNYQQLYVRAFTEGRIVSNVKSINYRLLPGRLTVEYDAGTKELKVTCPGTVQPGSGQNFYCQKDSSTWVYQNQTLANAKTTLSASGSYSIYWLGMPDYGLPSTWAGYFLWSGNIVIDGDEPTESFQKTIWLPIPSSWQPVAQQPTKVAVKLVNTLTANYWISPSGSGDGLTKDAPGSWASVLGILNSDGSTAITGAVGSPQTAIVVRATTGSYSADSANRLLKIPSNVTVIGGHDSQFKAVVGKSTVSSHVNSYGTMENFDLHLYCVNGYTGYTSATIDNSYYIKFFKFRRCKIVGNDSTVTAELDSAGTSYNYNAKQMQIIADSFHDCEFVFSGYYLFLQGSLYGCDFRHNGGGSIVLPSYDWHYDTVWNESNHSYEQAETRVSRNMVYFPTVWLQSNEIINSNVQISGVHTARVGYNDGGQRVKNSTVTIICAEQQGGIVSQGRIVDAYIDYAKSGETRPDGTYFDTWYEGATADGHDYHDQPWQAYFSNYCWTSTAAQSISYCMTPYIVSCGFGLALNSTIEISIPSTPNGGSGGNGFYKQVTVPSRQEWEYYDTGRVETYTWVDDEGVEHVETYPIWDYHEVTKPPYDYRFWECGGRGQDACDITVTLPKNLRKCKLNLTIEGAGNGGNGGNGSNRSLSEWITDSTTEFDRYLSDARYKPYNRGAGIPGLGGRIFINSPVRWTKDCDFSFAVGQGGLSGTNNFSGAGVRGNVPGNIVHPDGYDYNAWLGNTYDQCQGQWLLYTDVRTFGNGQYPHFSGVYSTQSYFEPTVGYYSGRGGKSPNELGINTAPYGSPVEYANGRPGGDGIPVDGFRTAGSGGGTAANGIKLGDFWE